MWNYEYRLKKNLIIDEEGWEILKLHKMLTEAGIEHHFIDCSTGYPEDIRRELEWEPGYQILLLDKYGYRILSVREGSGTYGFEVNRLEIMGLLTPEERKSDSVVGFLTAEDVFKRIKEYCGNENERN